MSQKPGDAPEPLLAIVQRLAVELHRHLPSADRIHLDSRFDRDLGFDSLARLELLARIEQVYGVCLPEQVLVSAETPRDLLRALAGAAPAAAPSIAVQPPRPVLTEAASAPHDAAHLLAVLDWHVRAHPDRPHIYLLGESDEEQIISYGALAQGAYAVAAGLQQHDLQPGETVAIMLPTGRDYFLSFYGVLAAGGIPVPIYPPVRLSQIEDHLRRHARILQSAQAAFLITVDAAKPLARLLRLQLEGLRAVITAEELAAAGAKPSRSAPAAQDIALL
ncbi:MAG: AMP-binding protein, partial [Deltaproteobacteria bacterium]